jgi:hypothetical protein
MVQSPQETVSTLSLETARLRNDMAGLNHLAEGFGQTIVRSFAGAIIQGRKLSDVLKGLALSLAGQALSSALKPLGNIAGDVLGGLASSPVLAAGAARSSVSAPAAPALSNVTINISTPDAASFRQSQSQVASVVARAVARGQRNL